jgi:hypothetical protein
MGIGGRQEAWFNGYFEKFACGHFGEGLECGGGLGSDFLPRRREDAKLGEGGREGIGVGRFGGDGGCGG